MNQCQHPQSRLYTFRYSTAFNMVAAHLLALTLVLSTQADASTVSVSALQIGYCGSIKDIDAAKAAGFDYFEPRTSEVAALSDAEYDKLTAKLKQVAMPSPVAYWFVPADIKLTGPSIDKAKQAQYLERALSRMSRLGVHVIVFGSSGARNFPEGFSKHEAFDQLVDFGKRTGPIARKYGITIAIEAQRREESNIINTTQESLRWVDAVNDPNIQLMVDYYHFESEKEDPAVLAKVKDHLRHIHMANPDNRVMPLNWEEYNYGPFFNALRAIAYNQTVGLEASSTNLQHDGPITVQLLHKALAP
jgi:D-psicose/D-tagatose/L-ribulose 3-epimerase